MLARVGVSCVAAPSVPSTHTRSGQAPDGKPSTGECDHVWCGSQRTRKSLRVRDQTCTSRGRGPGRHGWPRVLLTSELGAAQPGFERPDFERHCVLPAGADPGRGGVWGVPLATNLTFDQHGSLWFTSQTAQHEPDERGLVHTARRAAPPRSEGISATGLAWVGNRLYVASAHHSGQRQDHGLPRL